MAWDKPTREATSFLLHLFSSGPEAAGAWLHPWGTGAPSVVLGLWESRGDARSSICMTFQIILTLS